MIDETIQSGEYGLQPMRGGSVRFFTSDIGVNFDHISAQETSGSIDGFALWYNGQPYGFIEYDEVPEEIQKTLLNLCNEM